MISYQDFQALDIDLSSLGFIPGDEDVTYFCTPKGASILGWAGVDGVHFCQIRGFGEMVFAISPENRAPDYVHPVARDFTDFLRLILTCGDTAALEQVWMWDELQFSQFMQENPSDEDQKADLSRLAAIGLTTIRYPWRYIKTLQQNFDPSKIKYTAEYYDLLWDPADPQELPEWRVFFSGGFWWHDSYDRVALEIPVGKSFQWAGHDWLVPAIYTCGKGIVVDFCMRVDPTEILAFQAKWPVGPDGEPIKTLTPDEEMAFQSEYPLALDIRPTLITNGKVMTCHHGSAIHFDPCQPEAYRNEVEIRQVMSHYGLDPAFGWVIQRGSFGWPTQRRSEVTQLSVTMRQETIAHPGPHFHAPAPGASIDLIHPTRGTRYTLTVLEYERQCLPRYPFDRDDMEYPPCFHAMRYTIRPESTVTIVDTAEGDQPRQKQVKTPSPAAGQPAYSVGLIGGQDGPIAILPGDDGSQKSHLACSSPRFAPVEQAQWQLMFFETQFEDQTFELV